jgi:hypothetical protein
VTIFFSSVGACTEVGRAHARARVCVCVRRSIGRRENLRVFRKQQAKVSATLERESPPSNLRNHGLDAIFRARFFFPPGGWHGRRPPRLERRRPSFFFWP